MSKVVCKSPVSKPCLRCAKPIVGFPSNVRRRKYCSRACSGANQTTKIDCVCTRCGVAFRRAPKQAQRAEAPFCSLACRGVGITLAETFWRNVDKNGPIPAHVPHLGPCWLWTASVDRKGYGQVIRGRDDGRQTSLRAHRIAWEVEFGSTPNELLVLHRCDTPRCVRVALLFLGTPQDNVDDMMTKGRRVGHTKVTEDEVREMRVLEANGESRFTLAERYRIHPSQVWSIVRRRSWKHVP